MTIRLPRHLSELGAIRTPATPTLPWVLLLCIVVAATIAVIVQYRQFMDGYMTDDAFITFRYAENLANGLGPVWSEGERVEGYTNFGWVLLLGLSGKFGADPLFASRAFGLIASIGTLALIPLLAAQLQPMWGNRWWFLVIGGSAALALNSGFVLWTFAGLETTGLMFLITAGITLHLWEERTEARPVWSAPVFAAAALLRPDAVVVWAVTALFKGRRLLASDWRTQLGRLAMWAALFLIPFGIYWLWRWDYYGHFYPNTYYLRTPRSLDLVERGLQHALHFFTIYWIWLILGALVSLWRERLRSYQPTAYLLVLLAVWFVYVASAGGDWMPYFRLFIPMLPVIYVVIMLGIIDVADLLGLGNLLVSQGTANLDDWRRLNFPSSTIAAIALGFFTVVVGFSAIRPHDDGIAKQTVLFNSDILPGKIGLDTQEAIGLWMRGNLPPDYSVALTATGIVPYFSRLPTLDMLGVNDEHIAHLDLPLGSGPAGHEKWDGAYILSREPEIIWFALSLEFEQRDSVESYLPPNLTLPMQTSITQHPDIWSLYRPVAVPLRGLWLNLLVRNDVQLPVFAGSDGQAHRPDG